jgi:hypothetical protein
MSLRYRHCSFADAMRRWRVPMNFQRLSWKLTIDLNLRETLTLNVQPHHYTGLQNELVNRSPDLIVVGHIGHTFYIITNSKIWLFSIQRQDRTSKLVCESLKASGESGQAVLAKRIQFLVGDDDISLGSRSRTINITCI